MTDDRFDHEDQLTRLAAEALAKFHGTSVADIMEDFDDWRDAIADESARIFAATGAPFPTEETSSPEPQTTIADDEIDDAADARQNTPTDDRLSIDVPEVADDGKPIDTDADAILAAIEAHRRTVTLSDGSTVKVTHSEFEFKNGATGVKFELDRRKGSRKKVTEYVSNSPERAFKKVAETVKDRNVLAAVLELSKVFGWGQGDDDFGDAW